MTITSTLAPKLPQQVQAPKAPQQVQALKHHNNYNILNITISTEIKALNNYRIKTQQGKSINHRNKLHK
ncbi:hypothetical protein HYE07_03805 [Mycoplasmopsis bovis]|nr:hypothetical protein [Mycoplasmopsis bovis]QQH27423.1 hypothetical protein HYE07_03805 [Mycoplasmopsis bovis]